MAESRAAVGTAWSLPGFLSWPLRRVAGNIRITVALSVVLICGSFAAAAFIQMRNDRAHALSEAASFDNERAQELALDLGGELNRYAAIGTAFTNAASSRRLRPLCPRRAARRYATSRCSICAASCNRS